MQCKIIIPIMLFVCILAGGCISVVYALTVDEVLALKKAGVGDETIRAMIQQEKDGTRPATNHDMGKREIRDNRGDVTIEYSTGRSKTSRGADMQQKEVDRAWEMLQHLMIDARQKK